jgi:hypothetical protein
MGKKRKHNTNTRRKRQFESRMRGVENSLMREARLVDPQTITGMTMMSVSEIEHDARRREKKQRERKTLEVSRKKEKEEKEQKEQEEQREKIETVKKKHEEEEREHQAYLKARKPNYWETQKNTPEEAKGWWQWIFG